MEKIKREIEELLLKVRRENETRGAVFSDKCSLLDYTPDGEIWTRALQAAINEHEVVYIPKKDTPYYIDASITVVAQSEYP